MITKINVSTHPGLTVWRQNGDTKEGPNTKKGTLAPLFQQQKLLGQLLNQLAPFLWLYLHNPKSTSKRLNQFSTNGERHNTYACVLTAKSSSRLIGIFSVRMPYFAEAESTSLGLL